MAGGKLPAAPRPYLPVGDAAVVLSPALQQLLAPCLALLLEPALPLQLLELQVLKQLGLRLQGLRFLGTHTTGRLLTPLPQRGGDGGGTRHRPRGMRSSKELGAKPRARLDPLPPVGPRSGWGCALPGCGAKTSMHHQHQHHQHHAGSAASAPSPSPRQAEPTTDQHRARQAPLGPPSLEAVAAALSSRSENAAPAALAPWERISHTW